MCSVSLKAHFMNPLASISAALTTSRIRALQWYLYFQVFTVVMFVRSVSTVSICRPGML
jgi:hypothetical protein